MADHDYGAGSGAGRTSRFMGVRYRPATVFAGSGCTGCPGWGDDHGNREEDERETGHDLSRVHLNAPHTCSFMDR